MKLARASMQIQLLSVPPLINCIDNATARNAYGTAAQEIVCRRMKLDPIKIDGRCDLCWDAEKDGVFYEIKSVHRSGKVVIYDWRLQKELACKEPAFYAILVHQLRGGRNDIYNLMLASSVCILLIPVKVMAQVAYESPLRTYKRTKFTDGRNGYTRKGYVDGYRNISVKSLFPHTI